VPALAAQGHSSKEIAGRLVISPRTAGNHIEHIYTKTGCSSRAEASLYAMQQGPARRAARRKIGQTPHETAPAADLPFCVQLNARQQDKKGTQHEEEDPAITHSGRRRGGYCPERPAGKRRNH